ncbi:CST complex subunit STN1 isoform X2 [Ipomoea triloba]|uniref:CST complex subunit STN1 isoform X2 n=1 Tax=Ipomoea triloba TaxID=35885 RepID=UPI00125D1133|nr:CST complex subunit STN1 isoform X2 [Ipomoea triloba]
MDAPASLLNTHVKLLALDLLAVVSNPVDQTSFSRNGVRLCRVETMGVIVSREFKPGRSPADVRAIADMAAKFASEVQLGVLARVRGKIAGYRGSLQITVADVIVERDPNFEILHWLDCVKLSRNCYNVSTTKKSGDQNC